MHIWQTLEKILTPRYARELEAELSRERAESARLTSEISRLRAENRALLNSILGIAGIPPVLVSSGAPEAVSAGDPANLPPAPREKGKGSPHAGAGGIAPLRRRSWHQVMRELELASARKDRQDAPKGHGAG